MFLIIARIFYNIYFDNRKNERKALMKNNKNGEITLSFTDKGKSFPSCEF